MRIVLDTNVVISALLWRGTPFLLLGAILHRHQIRLFTSIVLLEELAEVLIRPTPSKRLALIGRTAHEILADYVESSEIVVPAAVPAIVVADPDDDHVIAAAVTAEADFIVTGDQHLLTLQVYRDIRIVNPADALGLVASQGR